MKTVIMITTCAASILLLGACCEAGRFENISLEKQVVDEKQHTNTIELMFELFEHIVPLPSETSTSESNKIQRYNDYNVPTEQQWQNIECLYLFAIILNGFAD